MFFDFFGRRRPGGRKRTSRRGPAAARPTTRLNLERLEDRLTPSSTPSNPIFVLQTDQSLWQQTSSGRQQISGPGSILAVSAVTDGGGASDAFVIASDRTLWEFSSAGWSLLSGGAFQQVSGAVNAAGSPVVFAVTASQSGDPNSLWETTPASGGWAELSPAHTILSVGAVTDSSGHAVAFAITADRNLWQIGSAGWTLLSPATFQSVSAGLNGAGQAVAYGVLTDDSLWEYNPAFGGSHWLNLSGSGTILAAAAAGPGQAFAITANTNLWQYASSGWSLTSGGSFTAVSGEQSATGAGYAFGVVAGGGLWQYGTTWTMLDAGGVAYAAAPSSWSMPLQAHMTGLPALGYSPKGTKLTLGASATGGAAGTDTFAWTVKLAGATVASGSGASFSFTPSGVGAYQVTLTATDSANNTATANGSVTADLPPTASLGGPYSGQAGSPIGLTASASNPNAGEAAGFTYSWAFGDGKTDSGTSATDSHVYAAAGTYTATVTVTDSVGETATATATVNVAPTLTATITGLPALGYSPKGTKLTLGSQVSGGVGADTYAWTVTTGGVTVASGTGTSLSFTPASTGAYQVALVVTDSANDTARANGSVTADLAPTVSLGGPYSGQASLPISLTASASNPNAGEKAGFTYSWSFGDGATDGGTSATDSHVYAAAGTYTATVTVTDSVGETATTTATVNVTSLFDSDPYITTPYLKIPNFGAKPTIYSVANGAWSSPATWNLGRVPAAGDIVDVNPGTTVTYDLNDATDAVPLNTVEVQNTGTLTFRTDVNTQICVANFLVLPGGNLIVGTAANPIAANVHANIDIANQALNSAADPNQFGDGLVVVGNVTMHGTTKTPYVTLAQEAHAGDTVLHLASPVTGWQVGDDPLLPDTRQLFQSGNTGNLYKPQWERAVIQSVSADGLTVTLSAPLKYDHLGARDANGVLDFLPQAMNDTRNVMVQSQSMTGARGYTLFTGYGSVDIEYAGFCELGRTTNGPTGSGNVADRYAMTVLDLIGPSTPQANGYQYTFIGNEVDNDGDGNAKNPSNIQWGLAVNNSFYGLVQDNDVFAVAGQGIGVEDGASSYNRFDGNFVAGVTGSGVRLDDQLQGDGFWFHNPNNYVTNNIATDINAGGGDVYSYGFSVDATTADLYAVGSVPIPTHQGADPSQAGQSTTINMNATPLLLFSGNEAYGATSRGFATWWLGTQFETPGGSAGTMKDSVVWNQFNAGYFTYETNGLVIDGFTARGDASQLNNPFISTVGLYFGDYMTRGAVVENLDIQDEATGVAVPTNVGRGGASDMETFTIQNAYLRNVTNIDVPLLMSSNGGGGLSSRTVTIQNVQFAAPAAALPSGVQSWNIYMDTTETGDPSFYNTTSQTVVDVYNYNDVSGDNFQAYYSNNHPAGATQRSGIFGYVTPL